MYGIICKDDKGEKWLMDGRPFISGTPCCRDNLRPMAFETEDDAKGMACTLAARRWDCGKCFVVRKLVDG